jgi:hypothetical protein
MSWETKRTLEKDDDVASCYIRLDEEKREKKSKGK